MNPAPVSFTVEALGWTLVHFLWQGTVAAAVLGCFLALARKASPQIRYWAACSVLLLMSAAVLSTFVRQMTVSESQATPAGVAVGSADLPTAPRVSAAVSRAVLTHDAWPQVRAASHPLASASQSAASHVASLRALGVRLRPWLPGVVGLWAVGVGTLSLRLFAGWGVLRKLRADAVEPRDGAWIERLLRLQQRLGVSRPVRLLSSASGAAPMVIGWLKPVVLVPAGVLTGLPTHEVEAILAHELAHIRRHDYLVNLLQNVVETVLFYHPAVWWVSGQIRKERENCCDDIASTACGSPLDYARALTALEELRHEPATLAVAASSSSLPNRIRRLAGVAHEPRSGVGLMVAGTAAVAILAAAILSSALVELHADGPSPPDSTRAAIRTPDRATINAPQDAITISVRDSSSKQPIPRFRVLAGVPTRSVSKESTKRTGSEPANWQPHTVRSGASGLYIWPTKPTYDEMTLRVEADGYQPQRSAWISMSKEPKQLEFLLDADPGITGRVLQPDGKPAAGATVARALPQRDVWIEQGRIRGRQDPPENEADRWRRPTIVQAGADGRFRLPTETDPASAVLIVHDSGVAELANADFQKQPEITLQRWGRIEGQVLWKDQPGVGEPISLLISRGQYMIGCSAETRTDARGRFAFDKVLPGRAQISRFIRLPENSDFAFTFDGLIVPIDVRPGDSTPALLGGQGRTLTGRLTGRTSWDDVTFHFHPTATAAFISTPGITVTGRLPISWDDVTFHPDLQARSLFGDAAWRAFGVFSGSSMIGPLFFRDKLKPNPDGTFEIPHLLPGHYQFFVSAAGAKNYVADRVIDVDPETPGQPPPPIDLGEILVQPSARTEPKQSKKDSPPDNNQSASIQSRVRQQAAREPHIIIAEHVLLWDNQIVTWDEVVKRLRSMRAPGPIHPTFHSTNGVHNKENGWQIWHDRVMALYRELFEPAGVSFASVAPRGSRRFDSIRTAADLRPDPVLARTGQVLTPDGNPAQGAQVVVLPTKGQEAILGVALEGTQLRGPFDEQWAPSDNDGRFTVYPKPNESQYLLAVLHSSGCAVRYVAAKADDLSITLEPWATLTFSTTGDVGDQSASLAVQPTGIDTDSPGFCVYEIKTQGKPVSTNVPAGRVVVQRTLKKDQGVSIGLPAQTLTLAPGERHTLAVAPPSAAAPTKSAINSGALGKKPALSQLRPMRPRNQQRKALKLPNSLPFAPARPSPASTSVLPRPLPTQTPSRSKPFRARSNSRP